MKSVVKKFLCGLLLIICVISFWTYKYYESIKIDVILNNKYYAYLPSAAKEYIKEVYEETGDVLLTEKNKKENTPYLNPSYVTYLSASQEEKESYEVVPISLKFDYVTSDDANSETLPSFYDLRDVSGKNYISPVKNQGSLGLCWSFASVGTAETFILNKNNTSYEENSLHFSERQIDYATSNDGILDYDNKYDNFLIRSLGGGGNIYLSSFLLANGVSAYNYSDFKEYNDKDFTKMELSDVLNYNKSMYELNSTIFMPSVNLRVSTGNLSSEDLKTYNSYINEVKKNILQYGGAYVETYMNSTCLHSDLEKGMYVLDVNSCKEDQDGHAMQIIGWDDNYEYSYCADYNFHSYDTTNCSNVVEGKGTWILKNSWGENADPYLYLTYDSKNSEISFFTDMSIKGEKNWDNNYILSKTGSLYSYSYKLSYNNLDKLDIKDTEVLKKVKFISLSSESTFTIKVEGVNETKEYTKLVSDPGLVTININDIDITKDSVITISSADGFFVDKIILMTSNKDEDAYINLDEYNDKSFIYGEKRLLISTKNIDSGEKITFKIYNSNSVDVTNNFDISNNVVADNEVNVLVNFKSENEVGSYKIEAQYNDTTIGSADIFITKMQGDGTESSPYIITTGEELSLIRNNLSAYYKLGNDIDLSVDTKDGGVLSRMSPICNENFGWESIDGFTGSLDGDGHTIRGLYQREKIECEFQDSFSSDISSTGNGLFSNALGNATIKNLVIEDFDIECYGGGCGLLVSSYNANNYIYGSTLTDKNEYTATFENIVAKNNKIKSTYVAAGTGLFGSMMSSFGTINIKNIYMNHNILPWEDELSTRAMLAYKMDSPYINIENVRLGGTITDGENKASKSSILVYDLKGSKSVNINNIISTVKMQNSDSNFINKIYVRNLNVNNINILSSINDSLFNDAYIYGTNTQTNINILNNASDFVSASNYNSWSISGTWVQDSINNILRIPTLSFANMQYTNIDDIVINQSLNETYNIYDYVTPYNESLNMLSYKSNDESIFKVLDNGDIIPTSSGKSTIHIESLYDGFVDDVPITVNYLSHFDLVFDANGGEGNMDSVTLETNTTVKLPSNTFTKEHYVFNGWNTKKDGTGDTFQNSSDFSSSVERGTVTLYAMWIGEEVVVNFDADGGTVDVLNKTIRYGDAYGDLPIAVKNDNAFVAWTCNGEAVYNTSIYSCNTLKASYKENAYNIIYYPNDGKLKNITSNLLSESFISKVYDDANVTLDSNPFIKDGYYFEGWSTSYDGDDVLYTDLANVTLDGNLSLYAVWGLLLDIKNNTVDTEVIYDGLEHTLDIVTDVTDYNIVYSLDNINFNLDTIPSYKEIGSFTIYYKITKEGYKDLIASNVVNIYGIKSVSDNIKLKNNMLILSNKSFSTLENGINVYSKNKAFYHLDSLNNTIYIDNIKTGDSIKISLNNKDIVYKLAFLGDVNGDGNIGIIDYIRVMKDIMGTTKLSGVYYEAADMNQNNKIDIIDYIRIMKIIMEEK